MAVPGHVVAAVARLAKDVPVVTAVPSAPLAGAGPGFAIATVGVDPVPPPPPVGAIVVTMTPSATATASVPTSTLSPQQSGDGADNTGECRLLGPFALIVQLALGGLALLSLVYKRWRERPQRPLKIWFFDVSKQVVGSVLVHIANVFMSMLTSGKVSIKLDPGTVAAGQRMLMRRDDYTPNPCSFYLLNLAIDTTLGIPILIVLLRVTTGLAAYTPFGKPAESIQSGNYGRPPRAWWWCKQSIIYFCGLFGMKICVLILFLMLPWISRVGDWALRWTEGNERLQIIFVMMLFPLIMNALQYYIIDSFIKQKTPREDDDDGAAADGPEYDGLPASDDDDDSEDELAEVEPRQPKPAPAGPADREYDPAVDGDSPTVIGSSSSQRSQGAKLLPKELYPHE